MTASLASTATYGDFCRYCAQFGVDSIDESLYTKLIEVFPLFEVFLFACDVYAGNVDGFTIQLWRAVDDCGTVSYCQARTYCSHYGMENRFSEIYGIAGDWEDAEDGQPIGIDAGELISWVNSQA